jgi:hypothetical protein
MAIGLGKLEFTWLIPCLVALADTEIKKYLGYFRIKLPNKTGSKPP